MKKSNVPLLTRIRESFITKVIALNMALFLIFDLAYPTMSWALTGGPSQPEASGFQPIETSDMVDIFSGDFKYNIPLMDMDGYPLNLAYNGAGGMDSEASWVGLGWSLNPGAVNRSMRGIPDDLNGNIGSKDKVKKTYNIKPTRNFGLNAGLTLELFGLDSDIFSGSLSYSLGVNYSNYHGIGIEQSIGTNLSVQVGPLNAGLGITSSSENGLTISPSIGLSLTKKESEASQETTTINSTTASLGLGTSYNTRAGVKQLSINTSMTYATQVQNNATKEMVKGAGDSQTGELVSGTFDLGMPTFTPTVSMNMHNVSLGANFQVGGEIYGIHGSAFIGGSYAGQKLVSTQVTNPAFGYMHLNAGQENDNALLDFNRENDGEFTTSTPHLPLANLTYDLFSVTGQGIGGSYRPFRSEIGHVFDTKSSTTSEGYDLGLEFGVPGLIHGAVNIAVNISETSSGRWSSGNAPRGTLKYNKSGSNIDYEGVYFKEANEKSVESDQTYYSKFGGDQAARFELNKSTNFNVTAKNTFKLDNGSVIGVPSANYRLKRDKRNQPLQYLSLGELRQKLGLEDPSVYLPAASYARDNASSNANAHHIGEVTTYGTDGMRYVYGIAAYNTSQKEVSFAAGTDIYGQGGLTGNCLTGEVTYNSGDNTTGNSLGLDNYYNATETPAYAHSYLLTACLSPDYIDADNIQGPSIGDLGYYTKFNYQLTYPEYKWRTPTTLASGTRNANYNEGLKTDPSDDKANYIYGTKEIWNISSIESKNYIAIFELDDRQDSYGVANEDGGINTSQPMQLLKKISFYVRKEYIANPTTAVPLKVVHFEYDYSLCPGVPNNINTTTPGAPVLDGNGVPINGKLTLRKVFFTYQNSNKARLSPYEFNYADPDFDDGVDNIFGNDMDNNFSYDIKGYDRWGNYKPNAGGCTLSAALNNAEFPYVKQNKTDADKWSAGWSLTEVRLPSGGNIRVEYESDDYAYVQHKRAMQMFKIVGFGTTPPSGGPTAVPILYGTGAQVDIEDAGTEIIFELDPSDAAQPSTASIDMSRYTSGVGDIYFKALMQMRPGDFDYTSGYAQLNTINAFYHPGNAKWYGGIKFQPVSWNDADINVNHNPMVKAAIQFARMNLQRFIYQNPNITDADSFGQQLINELFSSGLLSNLINNTTEFLKGPNKYLYEDRQVGAALAMGKGWLRLNNPTMKKLGGGLRVKAIRMSDDWSNMSGAGATSQYGQEYFYDVNGDGTGTSSGVASYEPQLGSEENPWKQPIAFEIEHKLAPDEKMFQEEPLGESFFPSPSVGYSKVTVRNLRRTDTGTPTTGNQIVTRHATGRVVHDFYTAKDFPTIVSNTDRDLERDKTNPFSLASLFNIASRDYLTASEGFKVEVNDMHGKPKKQMVFQEGQTTPITSVEYKYKQAPFLSGSFRVANTVSTIDPQGNVSNKELGVFFDMVADMRESKSKNCSVSVNINGESFIIIVPILVAPIPIPKIVRDMTQFRSATTTKVIQKFGILEETIAKDLGSVVSTRNLAYDSETGEVLVTQTTTDFNDDVYTVNFPAHWYYEKGMGQVYKNIDITLPGTHTFSGTGLMSFTGAQNIFVPGDELILTPGSGSPLIGWVINVGLGQITVVKKDGSFVTGSYKVKVKRPGRRNMAATQIQSVTLLSNPLTNFKNNLFTNVLQASAVEFSDQWRTFCDCFDPSGAFASSTTNPYVLGTKGSWRMKKSLLHLSQRTQSHYNNNTNIRKDGVFTSFTPYYRINAGNWMIDGKNWTFTSEVTESSPFGQELENKDALGRYSAATFGYRQSFATSVAANSRYRDIGFDNFEDYGFSPCADNHFKFTNHVTNVTSASANISHTGRQSIKVASAAPVSMVKALATCDPAGCNLSLFENAFTPTLSLFTIQNGTAPYNIEYNILSGDPEITLTATGFQSFCPSGSSYEIVITDANGCKYSATSAGLH